MSNNTKLQYDSKNAFRERDDKFRKVYGKPILKKIGDLRTLTLGGSPGGGDSGAGVTTEFPV